MKLDPANDAVTLTVIDPILTYGLTYQKPIWVKQPDRVVYSGVDPSDLAKTLYATNLSYWENFITSERMVDEFLEGEGNIPVRAGFQFVKDSAIGRLYEITAYDDTTFPGAPSAVNLSWFIEQWPDFFHGLAGHSHEQAMRRVKWPLWAGQPAIRFVAVDGGVQAADHGGAEIDYFKSATRPAISIGEAVAFAQAGDALIILDDSEYKEGEIVIDKPLTIVSRTMVDPGSATIDPTGSAFQSSSFPTLSPRLDGRSLRIDGSNGNITPVVIMGLTVIGGRASNATEPTFVGGGGLAIVDADVVIVDRCCFEGNETTFDALNLVVNVEPLKAWFRKFIPAPVDSSLPSEPLWFTQLETKLAQLYLAGQGLGGGVGFGWSSGWLRRSLVRKNKSVARGSGVGVAGYGWPVIDECHIVKNESSSQGAPSRQDGGGIGIEISIPDKLTRSLTVGELIDEGLEWAASNEFKVAELVAHAILESFDEHTIQKVARKYIQMRKNDYWDEDRLELGSNSWVIIRDCVITDNQATDGGGGVYASVRSNVAVVGGPNSRISDNVTVNGGGAGIRMSMGSSLLWEGTTITANQALGSQPPGSGGIACRNSDLNAGHTPSALTANESLAWAGGGVTLQSITEGNILNWADNNLWQWILSDVYGYEHMRVDIRAKAAIQDNHARSATLGMGGGCFIERNAAFGACSLTVSIESFRTVVSSNSAALQPIKDSNGVVISQTANDLLIAARKDQTSTVEGDDQIDNRLNFGGDFFLNLS